MTSPFPSPATLAGARHLVRPVANVGPRRRRSLRAAAGFLVAVAAAMMVQTSPATAGQRTCLTGTDPAASGDAAQIAAVRDAIETACPCAQFDGSQGNARGDFKRCAEAVIAAQSEATLRRQCRDVVEKMVKRSVCGFEAATSPAPCIRISASGRRSCTIEPTTKRDGTPRDDCRDIGTYEASVCGGYDSCIDAADTDGNLQIDSGDVGVCYGGFALRAPSGQFVVVDEATGALTASADRDVLSSTRFEIVVVAAQTLLQSIGNGRYLSGTPGSPVLADAIDQASADGWVIFAMSPATTDAAAAPLDVIILRDGPASATVDAVRADPVTGVIGLVTMNVVDAISDPNLAFELVQH
ncbi:MAG TPA: hypothetical protein VEL28_18080 [Candidatus Binatia bacterium]|nr:hypothetical protein [Candidatus Binatia bacterium]